MTGGRKARWVRSCFADPPRLFPGGTRAVGRRGRGCVGSLGGAGRDEDAGHDVSLQKYSLVPSAEQLAGEGCGLLSVLFLLDLVVRSLAQLLAPGPTSR